MATFDKLPAEQRAILELVLQRRQTYSQLADMLGMSTGRVRELARGALTDLSPHSAARVDNDWRGQVADYLLGQQTGPESTATRGHLKRSEPARLWALSLLDSLDHLYQDSEIPVIPEGEAPAPRRERERDRDRAAPARREERPRRERPARPLSTDAAAVLRRRRIAAAVAGATVLLLVLLVWPVGLLTGDGDEAADNGADTQAEEPAVLGQMLLRPRGDEEGVGIALVTERDGERMLIVQARGLQPTEQGQAYEVWLFNNRNDAHSLGAQLTDQEGNYQGAGQLPDDYENYRFLDISREPVDQDASHSGVSVLRGRLAELQQPTAPIEPGEAPGGELPLPEEGE